MASNASEAYKIYRSSRVGQALMMSLKELIKAKVITELMARKVAMSFDLSIKAFVSESDKDSINYTFKSKNLIMFRQLNQYYLGIFGETELNPINYSEKEVLSKIGGRKSKIGRSLSRLDTKFKVPKMVLIAYRPTVGAYHYDLSNPYEFIKISGTKKKKPEFNNEEKLNAPIVVESTLNKQLPPKKRFIKLNTEEKTRMMDEKKQQKKKEMNRKNEQRSDKLKSIINRLKKKIDNKKNC